MQNKIINLILKGTKNNLLITITNNQKKVLYQTTFGKLGLSKTAQKNPKKTYTITYRLGLQLKKKKIKYINIYFKGWSPKMKLALNGFLRSGLRLNFIQNKTPIPFNGCRLRKRRRKKKK